MFSLLAPEWLLVVSLSGAFLTLVEGFTALPSAFACDDLLFGDPADRPFFRVVAAVASWERVLDPIGIA